MEISEAKNIKRKEIREKLKILSAGEKAEMSYNACINVLNTKEFQNAKTIMVYKPLKNECDPSLIAEAARELGKTVVYPLCVGNSLKALAPKTEQAFQKGAYGIFEPISEKCDEVMPNDIDLVIVPGVAFSNNLARLGKGGGYYDRFLSECKNAVKIGFAFSVQLTENIPCEQTDLKMNKIVTNY